MQQPTDVSTQSATRPERDTAALLTTGPLAIVGGCGHVGLPLGLALARQGYQVNLIDTCAERVALVNSGRMPFQEEGAEELLRATIRTGRLQATSGCHLLEAASAVIV